LDLEPRLLDRLERSLSSEDRDRVMRLRNADDRRRVTAATGWLRHLLAAYLEADPSGLVLTRTVKGKPWLRRPKVPWLRFNLSHSAGLAVVGVARGREVGVDVEQTCQDFPIDQVVRRVHSALGGQIVGFPRLGDRRDSFFSSWVQTEAYLKGVGVGWGASSLDLRVPMGPVKPMESGSRDHSSIQLGEWTIGALDAGAGYAAAIAVEGPGVRLPIVAKLISLKLI
jgi:4'-phosphopantetheinyl transferase